MFNAINDWFWGTNNSKNSVENTKVSIKKKRRRRAPPRLIVSGYDLDHGLYRKNIEDLTYDASLVSKIKRLINSYEVMYEKYLNTSQFWNELQKIQDSGKSYHDMFTEKIVTGLIKTEQDRDRYSDVIDTVYSLAIKYGFIPDDQTHINPKKEPIIKHTTDADYILEEDNSDDSEKSDDDSPGWLF